MNIVVKVCLFLALPAWLLLLLFPPAGCRGNTCENEGWNDYMVVNLSTGAIRYTDTAPKLSNDRWRTKELWLKRIPKGTFVMGSPEDEVGRDDDEIQHQVTLTKDFYIGVFEITQKQYELVTGEEEGWLFFRLGYFAKRPMLGISYNMIRGSYLGAGWPSNNNVDDDSFLGMLRSKTGLAFDLPTEAQWEYACRAGTTTALNTGKNMTTAKGDPAMIEAGRCCSNTPDFGGYWDPTVPTAKVGSYPPNAWGLYDMHGNVDEWCLDWYAPYTGNVTDPVGASSGERRVLRSGNPVDVDDEACRSACRRFCFPDYGFNYYGFRVAFVPEQ